MARKKIMHPQSVVVESIIANTPQFNLKRFLDDMGIKQFNPNDIKNYIKVSTACKLLDISPPKFYKLERAGKIELHYIDNDPYNVRVKESEILGLMTTEKGDERIELKNRHQQ